MDSINTTTEILTLEEARRRLHVVEPLVARIMAITRQADEIRNAGGPDAGTKLENLRGDFETTLTELNAQGAVLKDAETGLIDFYGWHGPDMVFFCWRHGEKGIDFWHGIEDGFSGRQPFDETF